jgi:hypothetical protein
MRRPELSMSQILGWIDAFHVQTGRWPRKTSGRITGSLGETWMAVGMALSQGGRGLPKGSSLARLLAEQRGVRNGKNLPKLNYRQIVTWMDAHHQRTGMWPSERSAPIPEAPGETWLAMDQALRKGHRGLRGGASLARLLARYRGVGPQQRRPPLTVPQILAWCDAYHDRTGGWPHRHAGRIPEASGDSWMVVHRALRQGKRGLPGASSLAHLLREQRGVRPLRRPPLDVQHILKWADAHRRRMGKWPLRRSGPIPGTRGDTWLAIDVALRKGLRGLPAGSSLSKELVEHRGAPNHYYKLPQFTRKKILQWAQAHHQRTRQWPTSRSGPIRQAPGETWQAVDQALRTGYRGLPGGSSLFQLLDSQCAVGGATAATAG